MVENFFRKWVLGYPKTVLLVLVIMVSYLGWQATKLEVDASAETLTLEDDQDLKTTRDVAQRYGSPDFLVVTFEGKGELLSDENLKNLKALQADLEKVKGVKSVVSILNVPLMQSPTKPLKELLKEVPTLETPWIDKTLAKKEFLESPIYQNMLVSPDAKTTALQVNLVEDQNYMKLIYRRYDLRDKQKAGTMTPDEQRELDQLQLEFKTLRDHLRIEQHQVIAQVREAMNQHRQGTELFLGGVNMIADDSINFLKSDLRIFGSAVLVFLVITLWLIFRQIRWVLIPLVICFFSVVATSGFLGMFNWEVTVISSNFVSIQLIITMALTIHLIVRYREAVANHPDYSQHDLVLEATASMFIPCLYMVLTTVAGFCSLLLSGILPVINFGWMMSVGIFVSLFLTFLIFPALLIQMDKLPPSIKSVHQFSLTKIMANLTEHRGRGIMLVSVLVMVLSCLGGAQLKVENAFINYFRESTEIYQGMKVIDQQLGGTTPLDVVVNFPASPQTTAPIKAAEGDEWSEMDDFEAEFKAEEGGAQYWFTSEKMAEVEKIHDYLNSLEVTGKVVSLGTMLKVGRVLNSGDPLDNFALALVYKELPERFRKIILDPYVSVENDQVRFSIRVVDSAPGLRRDAFIKQLKTELVTKVGLKPDQFQVTGMLVLYNNMLQSLFNSQILTLGAVIASLMVMFMLLFQSVKISLIAIFPNVLSVAVVLGFMGWAGIPLDMMTITIASISVGIAVDDTIHYIHRFREEFAEIGNYLETMHKCHRTIAYAMYYTSVTIIIGFSILVLSNFIPSILFGLLTGLAMVAAWLTALTLLPALLIYFKPFGPERA